MPFCNKDGWLKIPAPITSGELTNFCQADAPTSFLVRRIGVGRRNKERLALSLHNELNISLSCARYTLRRNNVFLFETNQIPANKN